MTARSLPALTVERNAGEPTPRPNERRWGVGSRSDPVTRLVAPELGMKPQAVGHLMRHIGERCAAIIRAFVALQDSERLARFMRPILAAYQGRQAPPLCAATWNLAQEADASEDVAELAYQLEPTEQNLDRCIRATERSVQREEAKLLALYAERDRLRTEVRR